MHIYERNFKTLEEAQACQAITGGKISTFWSIGADGSPVLVYCVKYKQLF